MDPARGRDFRRLWAAHAVSAAGGQVTAIALPLVAILSLQATAWEIGVLRAASNLPVLALGLFVGVWVDRLRRRPLLVAADLGRALLLSAIPLAALGGGLRIELLYLVAFLGGTLSVCFDIAVQSFVPTVVPRELGRALLAAARHERHTAASRAARRRAGLSAWRPAAAGHGSVSPARAGAWRQPPGDRPRAAQARAISRIEPSVADGRLTRSRSRSSARRASVSDTA
jgi:MFS family permease